MIRPVRRIGLAGAAVAAVGAAIAGYLTIVKLAGALPVCGPLHGCETVATSPYAEVLGVPLAAFGIGASVLLAALQVAWWRAGGRRFLILAYALGLAGIGVVGYLTYLELFVIQAVCVWCAAYGVTIVLGWLLAALAIREG